MYISRFINCDLWIIIIKTAPVGSRDGSRISEEIPYFGKDIVSSSEQLHNQNICVAVIFVRDMLPPLKSQILKWGLLAQWLYWAKYLQAILACPAILLPGHGHIFLFFYCPDTDSLCCQHPSCLFTDVDCCITISVHLISTRTAVNSFG